MLLSEISELPDPLITEQQMSETLGGSILPPGVAEAISYVVSIGAAIVLLWLALRLIERIVCCFMKAVEEPILIEKVYHSAAHSQKIKAQFLKSGKKRIVIMPYGEYDAKIKGMLLHKGRYGITFTPEKQAEQSSQNSYYRYHGRNANKK